MPRLAASALSKENDVAWSGIRLMSLTDMSCHSVMVCALPVRERAKAQRVVDKSRLIDIILFVILVR